MAKMRMVWVTFQRAGFHRFPGAPDDVAYLAAMHRHLFKFKVGVSVTGDNREIEFHQFKSWLEGLYSEVLSLDSRSCEMIADDLYEHIVLKYPGRVVSIEVSEDGECGCSVVFYPDEDQRESECCGNCKGHS